MKGWRAIKLKDCSEIFPGYAFDSASFTENESDIPLVKGENLHQGYIDWATSRRWPGHDWSKLLKYQLKANDIVLAMDRPWIEAGLKWSWMKPGYPKALLVQRVARLRANKDVDQTFLRYIIGSGMFEGYIKPIVTGVNVPHISGSHIGNFMFLLPPLSIQRKIASILSAYDDLIENNNRRIAILEKMAEEIYREWFVRMRFPGQDIVQGGKKDVDNSSVGNGRDRSLRQTRRGLPEGWEVKKIGDSIIATMGQSPSSDYYNQNGIGLPFSQGVGTYGKRFPKKDVFCSEIGRIAEKGDILISVRAPVGRLNIADCKMIIGRGLAAFNHKKGYNSYLYYLLNNVFSSEDIIGNGAIFNSVTKDELLGLKYISPNSYLIELFENTARPIDNTIAALIQKNEILTTSRDLLLSRLVTGKLSVEALDIHFPVSMKEEEMNE
jgi:type I restriction enzyme S subunit